MSDASADFNSSGNAFTVYGFQNKAIIFVNGICNRFFAFVRTDSRQLNTLKGSKLNGYVVSEPCVGNFIGNLLVTVCGIAVLNSLVFRLVQISDNGLCFRIGSVYRVYRIKGGITAELFIIIFTVQKTLRVLCEAVGNRLTPADKGVALFVGRRKRKFAAFNGEFNLRNAFGRKRIYVSQRIRNGYNIEVNRGVFFDVAENDLIVLHFFSLCAADRIFKNVFILHLRFQRQSMLIISKVLDADGIYFTVRAIFSAVIH